jgi:dCMP deaminase
MTSNLWHQRFLSLAQSIAKWSKDPRTKVGAVAVDPARRIVETGYNGLPRGVRDVSERMLPPRKYLWTAHAEENLVAHAARDRLQGTAVFVTHLCCARCARMLINAGISEVVVGEGTTNMDPPEFEVAVTMFAEAGVKTSYVEKKDD